MPLIRRKPVELVLAPRIEELDDQDEVYYIKQTGEIFLDYEDYAARVAFYRQRNFQCELSGKINLTFFEALKSERKQAALVHRFFPEELKRPILCAVQFQVTGRIDELVDQVYERFKERYFVGERVILDIHGDKFPARVRKIHPSRSLTKRRETEVSIAASAKAASKANGEGVKKEEGNDDESDLSMEDGTNAGEGSSHLPEIKLETEQIAHAIGTDLSLDTKEALKLDHPVDDYLYSVQLFSEDDNTDESFAMALMERRADNLGRDRASFCKSILKKYLKECVVRESTVGSPWLVRPIMCEKYNIPQRATGDIEEKNRLIKEEKLTKRRKYLDEIGEDGTKPGKKRKGLSKEEKARVEAEKKEEEERRKAEERRKRMIKYPIEDLQLDPLSQKEIDATNAKNPDDPPRRKERPQPKTNLLPVEPHLFEPLMNSYVFLQASGKALYISPFTLDDFLSALNHDTHEPACNLINEVNAVLLNAVIRDSSNVKAAVDIEAPDESDDEFDEERNKSEGEDEDNELGEDADEDEEEDELDSKASSDAGSSDNSSEHDGKGHEDEDNSSTTERGPKDKQVGENIYAAARKLGKGWERKQFRADKFREGWEYALIGILAKRATRERLPSLLSILSHLSGVKMEGDSDAKHNGHAVPENLQTAVQRYPTLSLEDKILILDFLCEQAVVTRSIKRYFDQCEHHLTELRKERIELNRARRKLAEERAAFEEEHRPKEEDEEDEGEGDAEEGDEEDGEEEEDAEEDSKPKSSAVNGKKGKGGATATKNSKNAKSSKKAKKAVSKRQSKTNGAASDDEEEDDEEEDELDSDADSEGSAAESDYDSAATGNDSDGHPYRRNFGSRQEAMRIKALQREAEEAEKAKRRAEELKEHKARMLELRQVTVERKRFEDEEQRIIRREEAIEREFRQHGQAPRLQPMGRDRFLDKYWWFDGIGAATVYNAQDQVQYSTGRLFVQGPSPEEWEAYCDDTKTDPLVLEKRRLEEYGGENGVLTPNAWAVYTEPEEVDALMAWLRAKGVRELALRQHLQRFRWYLQEGMQKRNHHLAGGWKDNVETRRSNRSKDGSANRAPYMNYRNAFAKGL